MNYNNAIEKTILFIESHLTASFTVEDAAREAGYSYYHLNRQFSAVLGESAVSYTHLDVYKRQANSDSSVSVLSVLSVSFYLSSSLYLLNNLARRPPVNLVYNLHKPGHLVPGFPALRNQVHAHLEHMKHPLIHGHPALYSGPPGILGHLQRIA